jgi:hypothetical protein
VAKLAHRNASRTEASIPTDLLASLLIEQALSAGSKTAGSDKLTLKVYAVMTAISLLTFATLVTVYQLFFANQLFA